MAAWTTLVNQTPPETDNEGGGRICRDGIVIAEQSDWPWCCSC